MDKNKKRELVLMVVEKFDQGATTRQILVRVIEEQPGLRIRTEPEIRQFLRGLPLEKTEGPNNITTYKAIKKHNV